MEETIKKNTVKVKDMRGYWWLFTEHSHQTFFYGNGPEPTDHHVGNSTGVVAAVLKPEGLYLRTQSGSIYLVDWAKHRQNLANLIVDKTFLNSLGVKFPGDEFA